MVPLRLFLGWDRLYGHIGPNGTPQNMGKTPNYKVAIQTSPYVSPFQKLPAPPVSEVL